jgi:hypothetical protein
MSGQAFKNIDDVLRKEAGCTTELDCTEQTSWLLFLKYLDGLEEDKATAAELDGKKHAYILDKPYRWKSWAAPKGKDGKLDHNKAMTGDDLAISSTRSSFPTCTASRAKPPARTPSIRRAGACGIRHAAADSRGTDYEGQGRYSSRFTTKQQVFLDFVLSHYVNIGVDELDQYKLTPLLRLRYHDSIADAVGDLGRPEEISNVFVGLPKVPLSAGRARLTCPLRGSVPRFIEVRIRQERWKFCPARRPPDRRAISGHGSCDQHILRRSTFARLA